MPDQIFFDEVFEKLISLCREFAQGEYDNAQALFELTINGRYPVRINELAESFGMMVVQVEAREVRLEQTITDLEKTRAELEVARQALAQENIKLKSEVLKLRIEIDQPKKDRQVAEITETDYFRGLRKRAKEIKEGT